MVWCFLAEACVGQSDVRYQTHILSFLFCREPAKNAGPQAAKLSFLARARPGSAD
jgi:hypothetical protein